MNSIECRFLTRNKEETINLGKLISSHLFKGSIITLTGDLGAGKTTFTKGIAEGLNISDEVNSPTFNILKCYEGKLPLYHIDAYRLEDVPSENKNIGLEEVIEGDGVAIIEWPDFISEFIDSDLSLNIVITIDKNDGARLFYIHTKNPKYVELIEVIKNAL